MPNWCSNNATFSHEDQSKVEALAQAFRDENPFATFHPTPTGEWDYGWCSENWGTKWDAGSHDDPTVEEGCLTVWFDTAWSPPIGFYDHLQQDGWSIDATYHEPGLAFAGHYDDGENRSYEYDFSNEDWRDDIDDSDVLEMLESEYESWLEWQEDEDDDSEDSDEDGEGEESGDSEDPDNDSEHR